jgi:NADH-quinone oxidoreductase subunit I
MRGTWRAVWEYFAGIGRTVVTLGDGLAVTGSYLLRKPVTLQYPDRTDQPMVAMLPERSRGLLELDVDLCTGCQLCARTCPLSCIHIEVTKGKERQLQKFDIDLAKCMHCGLCAEACPESGIRHTREFEGAVDRLNKLQISFVSAPQPVAKTRKGEPVPPEKAKPIGSIVVKLLPPAFGDKK